MARCFQVLAKFFKGFAGTMQSIEQVSTRKSAIVAVARKMIEVLYCMLKSGEMFRGMPDEVLEKKILSYGIVT